MNTTNLDPTASQADYEELAPAWHDSQKYSPATRHRRRLILQELRGKSFRTVLEIGCGQPYLPQDISTEHDIEFTGTDISQSLIEQNRKEFPNHSFEVLDIVNNALPQQFDLILASEVVEHLSDYHKALENIAKMAKKYVLITVPASRVFPIDRMIGHFRHFKAEDLTVPLEQLGFTTISAYQWGFPFHNLYKHLINLVASPEKMRQAFGESEYTAPKKLVAYLIYLLFFLNIKRWGSQLVVLAERK